MGKQKLIKKMKMFPQGTPVQVELFDNGDIEYVTPLQEVEVIGYASDSQLGKNADYSQYHDWYLDKLREEAHEKAQYARVGFAPLTTPASDSAIIDGDSLKYKQRQFGDTIQKRLDTGFYANHPAVWEMDSLLFKRMDRPMSGFSCINSNTSYYGTRFADMNNRHFESVHRGFMPVSLDSLIKGHIIQLRRPWRPSEEGFRPHHAVMFNSYDEDGDINVWDQHGDIGLTVPKFTAYLHATPDNPEEEVFRAKNAFRFIGDGQTEDEIKAAYKAYRERNNIQD